MKGRGEEEGRVGERRKGGRGREKCKPIGPTR